jgi:hypothetical protein
LTIAKYRPDLPLNLGRIRIRRIVEFKIRLRN